MPGRITRIEVLLIGVALGLAAAWLAGAMAGNRRFRDISMCSANLRGMGSALYIYAQEGDLFPTLFNSSRAGEMTTFAYRDRRPRPGDVPSPTADLWALAHANNTAPMQFVCPASYDRSDPAQDTTLYHDFAGPGHLSYSYNYQYHPRRKPLGSSSNPLAPLMADANPYLKGGVSAAPAADRGAFGMGNSLNHRPRAGQNVLFVDSHVAFERSPVPYESTRYPDSADMTFPLGDNVYTTHADGAADPGDAPTWTRVKLGAVSDYVLVP